MGTIVCKCCDEVIEHYENEKVSVLFGVCPKCNKSEDK